MSSGVVVNRRLIHSVDSLSLIPLAQQPAGGAVNAAAGVCFVDRAEPLNECFPSGRQIIPVKLTQRQQQCVHHVVVDLLTLAIQRPSPLINHLQQIHQLGRGDATRPALMHELSQGFRIVVVTQHIENRLALPLPQQRDRRSSPLLTQRDA